MPLTPAPLPVQFSGGVELRQDPKSVPATKLLDLQNCVFTKQTTLSKRNGYAARSTQIQDAAGAIVNARGLAEREGEVLLFTDKRCYSQRPSADRWADTGEVAATTALTPPIARTGSYQTQPDVADRLGIRVVAWEDSRGGVWCSVIEVETDRILLSQSQLDSSASAKNPRCLAVGDVLHVLWTRSDLGQIQVAIVNPATPAAAPAVSILTADLSVTNPSYDAEAAINAPSASVNLRPGVIAWAIAGGGWRVGYIHASGVLGSPATALPSVLTEVDGISGAIAVSYSPATSQVAVVWMSNPNLIRAKILDASPLFDRNFYGSVAAAGAGYTRVTCAWGPSSGTSARVYWAAEVTAARSDLTAVDAGFLDFATITSSVATRLLGHSLVSRAWFDSAAVAPATAADMVGDVYAMVAHTARFFPYVAALRLSDDSGINSPGNTIVSRLLPGECAGSLMRTTGAGTRAWTTHLPSVTQQVASEADFYSRQHLAIAPYRIQLSSQNGDQFSEQGLKLCALDFDVKYQTVQLGRGLYLASSAPMHYDGDAWHEADFHTAPDFGFDAAGAPVDMTTQITMVATGSITDGSYVYAYWYEAVDAQGELHRSAPSVKLITAMSGGPRSFSHQLPTCRLTRFGNVRICVARTVQGATGTDTSLPLFRVTGNDVTITTGSNRYVNNDPTVDTVTFVDGLSDTELKKREPLYTNGGILPNSPAPWAGDVIATGKNRIYFTDSTDPDVVRFTQQRADDTAMEAPVDLSLRKDPLGGRITAIGILDDTVVPFTETTTFVFGGPGPLADPTAAPEANTFSSIEKVTSDVGCVSPSSVGETPVGLLFQSAKGIYLLDRQRQPQYVGAPVELLNDQVYERCTLLPDRQQIVLLTSTVDGFSLLWDYARNQWSKFSNHVGLDAIVVGGVYQYLRPDSRVFVETPGVYRDDNAQIRMLIETAWIRFNQYLQGWQKILWAYFLGEYESAHTLSVRYRIDYNNGYSPAILSDVNSNYNPSLYGAGLYGAGSYGGSGGGGSRYQRRIHIDRRCQSISFRIEDVEATGDFGASFELAEMLLIGGGLGPDFKVGSARSA